MDEKLQERLRKLYDNASVYFSLPEYDTFVEDMKDYDKLSKLRENMLEHYSMPPMEQVALDFGVKKKENLQPTSQVEDMDSPMETTFSDASKIIEKDEEVAISEVNSLLAGKGFSVSETGIGDALKIVDNITGEETEIDLQPNNWFGNKERETNKLLNLVNSKNSLKRRAISDNTLSGFIENKGAYLDKLENDFPQFTFERTPDGVKISKGDSSETFDFFVGQGAGSTASEKFSKINKFIVDNIDDQEASDIFKNKSAKTYAKTMEDIDAIKSEVDISDEKVSEGVYNEDYFKKLFTRLEAEGVEVSPEAKAELMQGNRIVTRGMGNKQTSVLENFDKEDIKNGISKYFSDNTQALRIINEFEKYSKSSVLDEKIKRATKLKIEQYYDNLPNKEGVRQIIVQKNKDIKSEEADILTRLELSKSDYLGMFAYADEKIKEIVKDKPELDVKLHYDESNFSVSISSSEKNKEIESLENQLNLRIKDFVNLIKKSEVELGEINAKNEDRESFLDASKRNYNNIDLAYTDLKNTTLGMGADFMTVASLIREGIGADGIPVLGLPAIPGDALRQILSKDKEEERSKVEEFYETKMAYDEVDGISDIGVFALRELATQTPNIALAIGTSAAGASLGLSRAAISTLVSTQFGVTSAGAKYDELTTRQNYGRIAKKGLKELELIKDNISTQEYLDQKFELERAIEDSKITSKQKTAAVLATGAIEFGISRFIGTVPNSINVIKSLKKPGKFLDDILMSNKKSVLNKLGGVSGKIGKATGGEIVEEESIEILGQVSDFALLGDKVDFSNLDDVLVTSIITSGAMNVPGTAYSSIITNINNKKYNSKIDSNINTINELKKLLKNPNLKESNRKSIHANITNEIIKISNVASEMEADALLVGADNIKELLVMSDVERNLNEKAGIKPYDSEKVKQAKIKAHVDSLDKEDGQQYKDNLKYISDKRNDILGDLNYETAIEEVFGEKGKEIAEELDEKLSPKEKYTKVYEAIRDDINKESVKEYLKIKEAVDFAKRMDENPDTLTDEELNFYSENKAVVDKVISERKEQRKQEEISTITNKVLLGVENLTESELITYNDNKTFIDESVESVKKINPDVVNQAKEAKRALSSVFGDITFKFYESEQEFAEDTGEVIGKTSSGVYSVDEKQIKINLSKATKTTVAHEVFHAVLLSKGMNDKQAKKISDSMFKSISKVASKELKKKITDFSKNYEKPLQSEESMAELFGILASEYKELDKPTQNIIKRFLNKLAKALKLKQFEDTDVVDLLNVLSRKVARGQVITKEDVSIIEGKTIDSPLSTLDRKQVGAFDVQYTEDKRREELVKKGLVVEQENLNVFSGSKAAITSPDDMLAGTISINGKQIFEGGGGVFFVTKYGDVWASGNLGTANTLTRAINAALKENGGKGYLVLAKGSDSKLISSASGVNSSLAVLESMLTKGLITPEIFRESTTEGINKFKTDTSKKAVISLKQKEAIAKEEEKKGRKLTEKEKKKIPKQEVTEQEVQKYIDAEFSDSISLTPDGSASIFIKELNAYFKNPKASTFVMRGDVLRNIISSIAKKIPVENKQKVVEFLGGDTNKSVGAGSTAKSQALVDLVTGVASEKLTKGLSSGDIYAVIEVNDEVEVVEDSHPSYPYHVRTKSGKPILHLPKQRDNGSKIFLTKKGNPYKVTQVSVMSGEFAESKPQEGRSRKQTFLTEGVNKAIEQKASKENKVKASRIIREKILDRQTRIKDLLKGIGSKESQRAHDLLVTKAGASGNANLRFKEAEDKIYKGLSKTEIIDLNEVIYLKRIISINTNRQKNKRPPYIGYKGIDYAKAGSMLNIIKAQVGSEKFNTLKERADIYFEVFNENLKRMYDAQLISEDVYNKLKDEEYSPIKTIKYLIPENMNDDEASRMSSITGMAPKVIKTLSNENKNEILLDSNWLLKSNISMIESRVFENRLLNSFFDAYNELSKEDKDAFSNIIKENPVVGKTKKGGLKYLYDEAPVPQGFDKVEFLKDGVKRSIIMDQAYINQLLDIKKDQGNLSKNLKLFSGVNVLRFMATAGNPLFIVGNTAVDFSNILLLSNTYSNNKFVAAPELAYDFIKNSLKKGFGTKEYKEIYKEFVEHGGSLDFLSSDGLRSIQGIKSENFLVNAFTSTMKGIGGVLSYLGETSELSFRLAVYEKSKANNIKKFEKENQREPTDKEMEDIKFASARESRETIDFNQGGTVVKQFDQVLPYLNAATQGFRKGVDFASENPKQFASNMLQFMVFSAGFTAASLVLLFKALDDEDDVNDVFKSISPYEKANYHIFFTGKRTEDGEFDYIRVKKLPLLSVAATMAEQLTIKTLMKSRGIDYDMDTDLLQSNIENSLPFVPTPRNLLSRNPVVSAIVTGTTNYDLFYDQEVFRNPKNIKLENSAKGADDDRVATIYKDLGKLLNVSPKISQAAVEKVITSENTNPLVGLFYSGYDKMFKEDVELGKEVDGIIDRVVKNSKKKVMRTTNKKLIGYAENELLEIEEMRIETETYRKEKKIKNAIKNNELTEIQLRDLIVENFDPIDHKRYWKKFTTYARAKDIDYSILSIIYEQNPKVQGLKIYNKFGPDFDDKEKEALIKVFKASRRKWSKKGLYYYRKKKQEMGDE